MCHSTSIRIYDDMTNNIATSPADGFNTIAKGIDAVCGGADKSTGAIASIALGILQTIDASNSPAFTITIGTGEKAFDVEFSAATLVAYARKQLPTKVEPDAIMPTTSQLIEALSQQSAAVTRVMNARDFAKKSLKKAKGPLQKAKHQADIERATITLNTVKQPLRRALTLAAYVLDLDDIADISTASVTAGKLSVNMLDEKDEFQLMTVTYADAKDEFSSDSNRAPQTNTGKADSVESSTLSDTTGASDAGITMRNAATRAGGNDRDKLAEVLAKFAGMLDAMDTALRPAERRELMKLYRVAHAKLDDTDRHEALTANEA